MPFLHWLRKKSRSTEAEEKASAAMQATPERITVTETTSENLRQVIVPDAPPSEKHSPSLAIIPLSATASQEQLVSATTGPAPTSHFSVPVGAFYAKLPPHLMAAERPDMTRLIEIAEADAVVERETQEATVSLSILSLSCPELFLRPIAESDEIPITFSVNHEWPVTPITVAESPDQPAAQPTENPTEARESASNRIEREIRLRVAPILSNLPPGLEHPSIRSLSETEAEIALPLDLIESQLASGRVVVSAAMFCRALPDDLKPYFETIEPTAEIPIPLREIFKHLPPEVINLREDQEVDIQVPLIQTPFSEQAEEDAKRFGMSLDAPTSPGPGPNPDQDATPVPNEAGRPVPAAFSAHGARLNVSEQDASSTSRPAPKFSVRADSERLQAIFMTDEVLDLAKTIRMVADLPGLRACLLNTADGVKLAGNLEEPSREQAVAALIPELFQQARSRLASMGLGMLETVTLYCGQDQLSTFIEDKLCLTVLHDNRPFKPGVREKIQAVIRELATLSRFEKEP